MCDMDTDGGGWTVSVELAPVTKLSEPKFHGQQKVSSVGFCPSEPQREPFTLKIENQQCWHTVTGRLVWSQHMPAPTAWLGM